MVKRTPSPRAPASLKRGERFPWVWWCAKVTQIPDDNSTAVLSSGMPKGLKGATARGGQVAPQIWEGKSLLWKKAQNQAQKNMASLKINKAIPFLRPSWVGVECSPWRALSRATSRHHKHDTPRRTVKASESPPQEENWNPRRTLATVANEIKDAASGQGLILTMWYG